MQSLKLKNLLTACFALCMLLFIASTAAGESAEMNALHSSQYEQALVDILDDIDASKLDRARVKLEVLLKENPKFKLAQMVYGDLLMAIAMPLRSVAAYSGFSDLRKTALKDELLKRWRHFKRHDNDEIPDYLLELAPQQSHVVVVDVGNSRLFLYENKHGNVRLVDDYYVSIGLKGPRKNRRGDKRTPLGVYFVNKYIPSKELPDLYGAGAFPINYPNEWDLKQGKTGYGIWLHGTPSYTLSRPPWASDGCITLSNQNFITLSSFIDVGQTPVIIADGIHWTTQRDLAKRRKVFLETLERWKTDWESRDIEKYLGNYAPEFKTRERDFKAWAENARVAYSDAGQIKISLSDLSVFSYPDEDLVVATFEQEYQSDKTVLNTKKRQYWKQFSDGKWKIVYEGPV